MVQFKSFGTVSYSNSVATATVSSAVWTQYTNVTDARRQTDTGTTALIALMHSICIARHSVHIQ